MQARGGEGLGGGIVVAVDGVGGEDVGCVRIGVTQEVGETDGGEGVAVGVGAGVEFHHAGIAGWVELE